MDREIEKESQKSNERQTDRETKNDRETGGRSANYHRSVSVSCRLVYRVWIFKEQYEVK